MEECSLGVNCLALRVGQGSTSWHRNFATPGALEVLYSEGLGFRV